MVSSYMTYTAFISLFCISATFTSTYYLNRVAGLFPNYSNTLLFPLIPLLYIVVKDHALSSVFASHIHALNSFYIATRQTVDCLIERKLIVRRRKRWAAGYLITPNLIFLVR